MMEMSPIAGKNTWRTPTDWYWVIFLLLAVSLIWCTAYNRWSRASWATPIDYESDALNIMAHVKAQASGEIHPILTKNPISLGAPFHANWNDYPTLDEGVFTWSALLARAFGPFAGSNLAVVSAFLLAASSFYYVCRQLAYHPIFAVAGAMLFSFSPYAFNRSLPHLTLTFYWHIPLGLLVIWYCIHQVSVQKDFGKTLFCLTVAVLYGIQNIYYTGMILQFLAAAALYHLLRQDGWSRVRFPIVIGGVVIATWVVMNLGMFYYGLVHGRNPMALVRPYADLELYALKPVELFLPFAYRLAAIQDWASKRYFTQAYFLGETGCPYLGIIGIAGLTLLGWNTVRSLVKQELSSVPPESWYVLWILLYSIVGGINGIIGVAGFIYLRGTNRYSIVILCLALLYLVRQLTLWTQRWNRWQCAGLAGALIVIGLLDQTPASPTRQQISGTRDVVLSDRNMVSTLERELPRRAMVFELPVVDYPEPPPVVHMGDYELFRPFLHSKFLRFSYGSDKGRPREQWQKDAVQWGPSHLVTLLEKYGFSAVLINRKGYEDRGVSILDGFRAAGRTNVLVDSGDFICVALQPALRPVLPPEFASGWYDLEGTAEENWHWSSGDAKIVLRNADSIAKPVHLTFELATLKPRFINIMIGAQRIYQTSLTLEAVPRSVEVTVTLAPGENELRFSTDVPADFPSNGDPRKLAFTVGDFNVSE
jgi:hypothetical protein